MNSLMLKQRLIFLVAIALFRIGLNAAFAQPIEIWEIQGAEVSSPYEGQVVVTEGNIVTARGNGFLAIQCPPQRADGDELTSDGIIVYGSYFGQPGDVVDVRGRVEEADGMTVLAGSNVQVTFTGQQMPLPEPVLLPEALLSPVWSELHVLERFEGMRVQFDAIANGPNDGSGRVPLRIGAERLFREPGIPYPGLPGLPVWDTNPELFWFKPNGLNAPNNRFINTGSAISATAIMIEDGERFWMALPDSYTVVPGPTAAAVREQLPNEFTVGSFNAYLLSDDLPDAAYQKRARYIVQQMRAPDIIALQEVTSLSVLNRLAYFLEQLDPQLRYDTYLRPSNLDLKLGYLVKKRLSNVQVSQLGANEVFTFGGGLLHDRPPLLLQALLPTSPPTPIQVLNIHARSLLGIESGPLTGFVRNKRHQQAISIASMVGQLRQSGNLVVVGDFNAFEFTDGYVDLFNQVSGLPSLGAQLAPLSIVTPPVQAMLLSLPPEERYSYVFQGNAQALDHCLTANLQGLLATDLQYARGNADFPDAYADNPVSPLSASDHDGLVLFLEAERPVGRFSPEIAATDLWVKGPNPVFPGQVLGLGSEKGHLLGVTLFAITGQRLAEQALNGPIASWTWPEVPAGLYFLRVESSAGSRVIRMVSGKY